MPYTGSIKKGQAMDTPNLQQDITNIIKAKGYNIHTTLGMDMIVEELENLGWQDIRVFIHHIGAKKAGEVDIVGFHEVES
jgi:hypothetical protein